MPEILRRLGARTGVVVLLLLPALSLRPILARDTSSLARDNYYVRIALVQNVRGVAVRAQGRYRVVDGAGRTLAALAHGQTCRVEYSQSGGAATETRVYRLVLRELPDTEANARTGVALARAAATAHGVPAKALRAPPAPGSPAPGSPADATSRILVALGEFPSAEEARAFLRTLNDVPVEKIFEERVPVRPGGVTLKSESGGFLASDPDRLRLIPEDLSANHLFVREFDGEPPSAAALQKARTYRGHLVLARDRPGRLTAINQVWLEHYVYGVVAAEIGADAPLEALKAQAVVARSETVAKIERGMAGDGLWDFTDEGLVQVYLGKGRENSNVRRAVDATRGEALSWGGRVIDAVYSHSCGGVVNSMRDHWGTADAEFSKRAADRATSRTVADLSTDDAARAWTERPVEAFCNPKTPGFPEYAKPNFRWTREFTGDQLSKMFSVGRVQNVIVEQRSPSGRAMRVKVVGERSSTTISKELNVREALGGLKSNFFTLDVERAGGRISKLTVHGAGHGHGVGMCQMGAFSMALGGYGYRQILGLYYAGVQIRKLYD